MDSVTRRLELLVWREPWRECGRDERAEWEIWDDESKQGPSDWFGDWGQVLEYDIDEEPNEKEKHGEEISIRTEEGKNNENKDGGKKNGR